MLQVLQNCSHDTAGCGAHLLGSWNRAPKCWQKRLCTAICGLRLMVLRCPFTTNLPRCLAAGACLEICPDCPVTSSNVAGAKQVFINAQCNASAATAYNIWVSAGSQTNRPAVTHGLKLGSACAGLSNSCC